MVIVIATFIGLASLLFIWYPFVRKGQVRQLQPLGEREQNLLELESQRNATYAVIKELDFDYQTGKLSPEDYQSLRGRYEQTAIGILAKIDTVKRGRAVTQPSLKGASCSACGAQVSPSDRFCPECGAKVPLFCSSCGAPVSQGFRFCPACGQAAPVVGKI